MDDEGLPRIGGAAGLDAGFLAFWQNQGSRCLESLPRNADTDLDFLIPYMPATALSGYRCKTCGCSIPTRATYCKEHSEDAHRQRVHNSYVKRRDAKLAGKGVDNLVVCDIMGGGEVRNEG